MSQAELLAYLQTPAGGGLSLAAAEQAARGGISHQCRPILCRGRPRILQSILRGSAHDKNQLQRARASPPPRYSPYSGALSASADDYPNSVRLGSESVFYHTNADDVSGPYVPPGVNIDAQNLETLYAGYVRTLSSHFAVELALGYPPLAKVNGGGCRVSGSVPYNGQVVSSARWLAPTLFLEYNFLSPDSLFRPYLGVGVNYTNFYDRDTTAAGNAAFGGPTKISLTASVQPAVTGGVDYHVSQTLACLCVVFLVKRQDGPHGRYRRASSAPRASISLRACWSFAAGFSF